MYASKLPESIQQVLKFSAEKLNPSRIVLFGSRARGDNRENSDFDIAFFGVDKGKCWSPFLADVSEKNLTLYKLDLVLYEDMNKSYQRNIDKEGIILYEH